MFGVPMKKISLVTVCFYMSPALSIHRALLTICRAAADLPKLGPHPGMPFTRTCPDKTCDTLPMITY